MDYQFVCVLRIFLIILAVAHLHRTDAIIGRDLVLTPKRGLQLSGKSIFYEEDSSATTTHNQTVLRPWERTLKHVTFVTLFTNAAADAVAGNISKQKAYSDFLSSPYIQQHSESDTRFGDIVTLANGRLEETANNSFRFVEGLCDYDCDAEYVWALWQVQRIRHRDANRKFRYEMKFSVSPLRAESGGNIKRKAELDSNNSKRSVSQTFIQRDDDYPHTFGKIVYNAESRFADRRFDDYAGRNFRQAPINQYRQATPMPQPTFMHGIFQPHPHFPPPLPQKLNIGEYIKDYPAKATPKVELFPNILNAVSRNYYPTPTTYRPNYQTKFPRPELYPPTTHHEPMKFPDNPKEPVVGGGFGKISTPVVTHHFHHHFYMPSTTSIENGLGSAEQPINNPTNAYKSVATETTAPTYFNSYYNEHVKTNFQQALHPPKTINFPKSETEVHKEHVVQVTPVPPLKRPQIYQMYQIPIDSKVPLLIYPAPVVEEQPILARNKPFIQSEPMDEEPIRYSEPDPLYLNLAHNPPIDVSSYELSEPQLEAPKINQLKEYADVHINTVLNRKNKKPDSIAAQLPPPENDQDVRIPYEDESQEASKPKHDLEQKPSQKDEQISIKKKPKSKISTSTTAPTPTSTTEKLFETSSTTPGTTTSTTISTSTSTTATTTELFTSSNQLETIKTLAPSVQTTPTNTLPTTNSLISATTGAPSTTSLDDAALPSKQSKFNFISTSTSETPSLRALSRYRLKHMRASTTTTEQPVLKWKPRRKHSFNNKSTSNSDAKSKPQTEEATQTYTTTKEEQQRESNLLQEQKQQRETKASHSQRQDKQLSPSAMMNSTKAGNDSLLSTKGNEVFEVLTQKSVSKSVSIKVGNNGEEIPVIVEDNDYGENEVKTD
ncbi:mucin-2 [Anastrepha ludens]|uniref:mucin-2 n=1 Tax=Anastrepha ludens TaxID=28586 RepID=UPI0023AF93C3|nr:mucin-2 [Anastrepha ludens]